MSLSFYAAVDDIRQAAVEHRLPGPKKKFLWATILAQVAKRDSCDGALADLLLEIIRKPKAAAAMTRKSCFLIASVSTWRWSFCRRESMKVYMRDALQKAIPKNCRWPGKKRWQFSGLFPLPIWWPCLVPGHLGHFISLGSARRDDFDRRALLLADQRARER